jgi:hypothetical protein
MHIGSFGSCLSDVSKFANSLRHKGGSGVAVHIKLGVTLSVTSPIA